MKPCSCVGLALGILCASVSISSASWAADGLFRVKGPIAAVTAERIVLTVEDLETISGTPALPAKQSRFEIALPTTAGISTQATIPVSALKDGDYIGLHAHADAGAFCG